MRHSIMKKFAIRLALLLASLLLASSPALAAYRASSATVFTTGSQTTTSLVINSPVGVALNDIVVCGIVQYNGTGAFSGTGFTQGGTHSANAISQGPKFNQQWFWKVATGSEPSTYTFTVGATFDASEAFCGAWTGRNTTTPVTGNQATAAAGSSSPVSMALTGVTGALSTDDAIVFALAAESTGVTWSGPSGYTAGPSMVTATPFGNAYFSFQNAFAASGTQTVTETGIGSDNIGFVISLAASSGGAAALASAASNTTSATGALTAGGLPFAPLTIGLGTTPNDGTGDPARTAFNKLNVMEAQLYGVRSVQTPTTGFTQAPAHGVTQLVLNPAGTLATGTVTFPPAPGDNQPFELVTTQTVTALTLNTSDGSTIASAPTTITAAAAIQYRFIASLGIWLREQ